MKAVEAQASQTYRYKLATAAQYAESMISYMKRLTSVKTVTVAGSFRRMRETVGDLDLLVTASEYAPVM